MLNKKGKTIFGILFSLIIIGLAFFTYKFTETLILNYPKKEEKVLLAQAKTAIDYEVCLNQNNYLEEICLDKNNSYIAQLVKELKIDFNYDYQNDDLDYYRYEIIAKITSSYIPVNGKSVNHPIWEKDFVIKESESFYASAVSLDEAVTVDLLYYDNLARSFSNELSIPAESNLKILFKVYLDKGNSQETKHVMGLKMPLAVDSFDIEEIKLLNDEMTVTKVEKNLQQVYASLITYILAIAALIVLALNLMRLVKEGSKHQYRHDVDKLLKNYSNRIIEVNSFIDYTKMKIIDVISFDELLNLSDEIFEPITHWEKTFNRESWFNIFHHNILYRYILKAEETDKKDSKKKKN